MQTLGKAAVAIFASCLIGCKNYSVSLNDKTVYTPAPLFTDYQIADAKLNDCVEQTIYDLHITTAADLTRLNCSNAGIKSLIGLDKFFALTELNLANNNLSDISEIANLGRLEVLLLNTNAIKQASPLLHLLHLQQLDMSGNSSVDCKDLYQLADNLREQKPDLKFPEHCKKNMTGIAG